MKKLTFCLLAWGLWVGSGQPLFSGQANPASQKVLKLRVFEGLKERGAAPTQSVTASYLKYTLSANLQSESDLQREQDGIKKAFNLDEVRLLTESSVTWRKGDWQKAHHMFRLDGKLYAIALESRDAPSRQFRIEINEVSAPQGRNLLDTEFTIQREKTAVFGFEDKNGKPYFCSFHITGPPDKIMPPPPPPPPAPPVPPEVRKKIEEFEKGAVKASDAVNPPRLLKKVDPVYPPGAKESGLKGYVVLNVRTDGQGNVKDVMVIRSTDEVINQPAITAVKQWKYEPYLEKGQPRELVFSVSLRFESQ